MTPLALRMAKRIVAAEESIQIGGKEGIDYRNDEILKAKCFEATEIVPLFSVLKNNLFGIKDGILKILDDNYLILPSEITWIECALSGHEQFGHSFDRIGFLLHETGINLALVSAYSLQDNLIGHCADFVIPLKGHPEQEIRIPPVESIYFDKESVSSDYVQSVVCTWIMQLTMTLYCINSPRVLRQVSHQPHRGFQKTLNHMRGFSGNMELRPWTEIKLDITPPPEREGGSSGDRLTGAKALHFCRSFLRIRNGKLERVRSHWRGDPALGVVRADYKVRA